MTQTRYTTIAIILHWLIAAMVLINVGLGLYFVDLPQDFPNKSIFTQTHKSIGLTVLVLSIVRLAWRLTHPAPPLMASALVRVSSRIVHALFYFLLIAVPLAGWCIVSVSPLGITTIYFGSFPWPHIGFLNGLPMETRRELLSYFVNTHNMLAFLTVFLVIGHVGAALYHQFILRDNLMARIWPGKDS